MADVRWSQRFQNYNKAVATLQRVLAGVVGHELIEVEQLAVIQAFEFTHELAWNLLRDYLREQGSYTIAGSKDATRLAFQVGAIADGELWMAMINDRNLTSHAYEEVVADAVADRVQNSYLPAFLALQVYFAQQLRERSGQ